MTVEIPGYQLGEAIGQGGAAIVYRAVQNSIGATVAVKLLRDSLSQEDRRRAERERRTLGALRGHPGIVTIYDGGVTPGGRDWIAMELLEGGSLDDKLATSNSGADERAGLPWADVADIGLQIGAALEAAHGLGVIHRDVKPANIMLTAEGRPKLTDFGIARTSSGAGTAAAYTPAYASPETLDGQPATEAADVYSLALTLYEVASGTHPFTSEHDASPLALLRRIALDVPPPLIADGISHAAADAINQALAKDPAVRPAMSDLVAALGGGAREPASPTASGRTTWRGIPGLRDVQRIAQGGFGAVYRAMQERIERPVAVKVLSAPLERDSRSQFDSECQILGLLGGSAGIIGIHDAGVTDDGFPYLMMPWLEGGSLRQRLEQQGRLPPVAAVALATRLARALAAAHAQGVLHLDVKPDNVLFDHSGDAFLTDFGIARLLSRTTVTAGDSVSGTPQFAAPEVLDGRPATPAADVYSWAATMYTAVAGRPPFDSDAGLIGLLAAVLLEEPAPLPDDVPAALADVLMAGLRKDPSARPTLTQSIVALGGSSAPASVHATTPAPTDGAARGGKPRGTLRWAAAGLLGLVALLGLVGLLSGGSAEEPQELAAVASPTPSQPGQASEPPATGTPEATTSAATAPASAPPSESALVPGTNDQVAVTGGEETLTLSFLLPQASADPTNGGPAVAGFLQAFGEVQAAGGVNGRLVILAGAEEGPGDGQLALSNAQELIDGVTQIIVGPLASANTLAVIGPVVDQGVTMCGPAASASVVNSSDDGGLFFSAVAPAHVQGTALALEAMGEEGVRNVAIVARDDEHGRSLQAAAAEEISSLGGRVVLTHTYATQQGAITDLTVDAVLESAPDAVIFIGYEETGRFVDDLLAAGLTLDATSLVVAGGPRLESFTTAVTAGPSALDGTLVVSPSLITEDEDFLADLAEIAPQLTETTFAAETYDCTIAAALAAHAGGANSAEAIALNMVEVTRDGRRCTSFLICRDLLNSGENIDYDGVSGPLDMGEDGYPVQGRYLVERLRGGIAQESATVVAPR